MDFFHIHGRYSEEENLPWDFKTVINKYLKNNMKLLTMETDGGEFLLSLNHPKHNTSAIEGYQPNVELCKKVYILSLLTLIITFFLIIFSKSLFWLSVAYTIYGLANALETGTLDVILINSLKNNETGLQKFLKYQKQISTFSSILGSGIGFLLYFKIGVNIYFISIVLIFFNMLLTALFFSDENKKANENINFQIFKRHIAECISELKEKRVMKYYFIFFGIIQIFIQSHFQLWQKLFLDKGIGEKNFFVMYVMFQIIVIIRPVR